MGRKILFNITLLISTVGASLLFIVLFSLQKWELLLQLFSIFLTILSIFIGASLIIGEKKKKWLRISKDLLYGFIIILVIGSLAVIGMAIFANIFVETPTITNLFLFILILIFVGYIIFTLLKPLFNIYSILEKESNKVPKKK